MDGKINLGNKKIHEIVITKSIFLKIEKLTE